AFLGREAAHALGADLLEDAVELVEQLLLLAAAASADGSGACGGRTARALVVADDLESSLVEHASEPADAAAGRAEAEIEEAGGEAAEVCGVGDVAAAGLHHGEDGEDGEHADEVLRLHGQDAPDVDGSVGPDHGEREHD